MQVKKEKVEKFNKSLNSIENQEKAIYVAMIESVDESARVIEALEKNNLIENTLVILQQITEHLCHLNQVYH